MQILDDITLTNLDVVDTQGRPAGTLLHRIDHTVTAFGTFMLLRHTYTPHTHSPSHIHTSHPLTPVGKRRLREWVCAPMCDPQSISAHQEAVADLINHTPLLKEAKAVLVKLPDLERKIRK